MKLVNFTDESVQMAEAAMLLGFDVVKKENVSCHIQGKTRVYKTLTYLENTKSRYEVPGNAFPELDPEGDDASDPNYSSSTALTYVIYHKEINEHHMNQKSYQKANMENVYRPMSERKEDGSILIFNSKTLVREHQAKFLTNFSKNIVEKIYLAILKMRERDPEFGKRLFIYKESYTNSGKNAGKFGIYTELYSLWYNGDDINDLYESLDELWKLVWEASGVRM